MASHGRLASKFSKFFIDLDGDFKAFNTPRGDQLNLYLNSLGVLGTPPQYDRKETSVSAFIGSDFLKSSTSLCAIK